MEIVQGSITNYEADALVCPANGDLEMVAIPGGIQYAFLVDGGKEIFEEAREIANKYKIDYKNLATLENGIESEVPGYSANLTGAGKLPAKHVIHSVAVIFDEEINSIRCDKKVIGLSVRNALDLGRDKGLKSIGFPALGTGLYNVPIEECSEVTLDEFEVHLNQNTSIERLGLVLYSQDSYEWGKQIADEKFLKT